MSARRVLDVRPADVRFRKGICAVPEFWQVHRGQCGADDGVLGIAEAYTSIKVGDDGRGTATATVPMTTPTSGRFFVTVQASVANPEMIVACGNLAAPTR